MTTDPKPAADLLRDWHKSEAYDWPCLNGDCLACSAVEAARREYEPSRITPEMVACEVKAAFQRGAREALVKVSGLTSPETADISWSWLLDRLEELDGEYAKTD